MKTTFPIFLGLLWIGPLAFPLMASTADQESKTWEQAPVVGENRAPMESIFKNFFRRGQEKGSSWWETMEAKPERKAWKRVEPVKVQKEGVAVQEEEPSASSKDEEGGQVLEEKKVPEKVQSSMPRGFVGLRVGAMKPEISRWDTFYEDSRMKNIGLELGWHLKWGVSLVARAQTMEAEGQGLLTSTNALGSDVDYRLIPLQGGLQWEFGFTPKDWVRPFIGGGYVHALYRQDVSDGRRINGNEGGFWAKSGLLVDLSQVDGQGIRRDQELFEKVDLVLEVERIWLKMDSVGEDIGGFNLGVGFRVGF